MHSVNDTIVAVLGESSNTPISPKNSPFSNVIDCVVSSTSNCPDIIKNIPSAFSPNLITATQPANHWSTGSPSIINVRTNLHYAGGENINSFIYTNGTPDIGQAIYGPLSGLFAQEGYSQMDNQWDDTKLATWAIGHKLTGAGALIGSDGFGFATFQGQHHKILSL